MWPKRPHCKRGVGASSELRDASTGSPRPRRNEGLTPSIKRGQTFVLRFRGGSAAGTSTEGSELQSISKAEKRRPDPTFHQMGSGLSFFAFAEVPRPAPRPRGRHLDRGVGASVDLQDEKGRPDPTFHQTGAGLRSSLRFPFRGGWAQERRPDPNGRAKVKVCPPDGRAIWRERGRSPRSRTCGAATGRGVPARG